MKIAHFSTHGFDRPYLENAAADHESIFITDALTPDNAHLATGCEAVTLFTSDDGSAASLARLKDIGVKSISLRSAGYDHVDIDAANALGMRVANVLAYSPYAVAEHAMALLLTIYRKLRLSAERISHRDFRLDDLTGTEIHGKTVGIVGAGRIGEAFARIVKGFGAHVLFNDTHENGRLAKELDAVFASINELCKRSDIISIHCPLTQATRHLFTRELFSIMRPNAVLINTARGAVVNTRDLVDALHARKIAAAGLDVYEFEKGLFFFDHSNDTPSDPLFEELLALPQVVVTGHQAFLTDTALSNIAEVTIHNLDVMAKGGKCENELKGR